MATAHYCRTSPARPRLWTPRHRAVWRSLAVAVLGRVLVGKSREDPRFLDICARAGMVDYWLETGLWPDCADEVP
jgi:hypothetical protein